MGKFSKMHEFEFPGIWKVESIRKKNSPLTIANWILAELIFLLFAPKLLPEYRTTFCGLVHELSPWHNLTKLLRF